MAFLRILHQFLYLYQSRHMKRFLFLILVVFFGCTPKQVLQTAEPNNFDLLSIEVNFMPQNSIEFAVVNQSDTTLKIFQYYKLQIEQKTDEGWVRLRILHCPCGAPCAKPSEFIKLLAGERYTKSWDMQESWCGESEVQKFIPETITTPVSAGLYRIAILYGFSERDSNLIYKEFNIK